MPVSPATKVLCSVLLAGALMPACAGCENPAVQGPGSSGLPGLSGTDAGTTSNPADGFASVVIEPANPVVTTRAGVAAAQAFSLVGVKADGSRVPVATAEWSGDHDLLGTISAQGNFSITGAAAGSVRVRGLIRPSSGTPLVADTTLTVKMTAVVITPGTPMDAATQFENAMPAADTSGRVALLYPLHEAVMPRNVPPADIQWEGGEQGDLFRVTLKKSNITLEAYLEHTGSTFNDHWLVETAAWRTLAASDPSEKLCSGTSVDNTVPVLRVLLGLLAWVVRFDNTADGDAVAVLPGGGGRTWNVTSNGTGACSRGVSADAALLS